MSNMVMINLEMFLTDDPEVVREYDEYGHRDFPSYQMFKDFFIELGSKYPDGIPEEYFKQLHQSYTNTLAVKNMIDIGLIEEVTQEDGTIGWRIKSA